MKKHYNRQEDYWFAQKSSDINILTHLSFDENPEIRKLIILNRNTPPEILRDIAYKETKNSNLRALATNSKILPETFEYLIQKEESIIDEVIENKNVPISILEKLKRHHHCPIIREEAEERILELKSEKKLKVDEVPQFFKIINSINSFLFNNKIEVEKELNNN